MYFFANSKENSEKDFFLEGRKMGLPVNIIAFGPVMILSLFWSRLTYKGAIAGIVSGAVVDIVWLVYLTGTGIYEILPAFAVGFVVCVVASLIDKKPSQEILEIYKNATDDSIDD